MRRTFSGLLIALGLLAAAVSASCGGDDGGEGHETGALESPGITGAAPEGAIRVSLLNWAVQPEQTSASAGEVTFWAVHDMQHSSHGADEGGDVHDLQVLKKTAGGGTELVGQVQGLRMGEARALTVTLEPGEYELACTVVEVVNGEAVGHYSKGMRTAFTVTA